MTNLEIHEKIEANNRIIQSLLDPSSFVLNNTIKDLLKKNEELQEQCEHHFVDGFCEYCYIQEPKKND